ncbi:MAG: ATP-binding protein [Methanomassiliicoccales archaeon]|nr:ATP-binding protein [Methanomassiliicoccales archaeon]
MVAFAIVAWVVYQVYIGKRTLYRRALLASMFCICITVLTLLAEKLTPDLHVVLILTVLEYTAVSILVVSMTIYLWQFVGQGRLATRRNVVLLSIIPIITVVAVATNDWHHLYYVTAENAPYGDFYMFSADHGPLFFMWMAYFLFLIVYLVGLLFRTLADTPAPKRKAVWSLIVAIAGMMVIDILYIIFSGTYPFIDFFSIGYAIAALSIFIGESMSTLLDLEIVGVQEAIGEIKDGIVVLDPLFHREYANELGEKLLNENYDLLLSPKESHGLNIPLGGLNEEMRLKLDGSYIDFIVASSDIVRDGKVIGSVLVFHDISIRKSMEDDIIKVNRRLTTLNQVIRHDIRNDILSLWSYLELLDETELDPRQKELVEKLLERVSSTDRYMNLARDMAAIGTAKPIWHDVGNVLDQVFGQVDMGKITVENQLKGVKVLADPLFPNIFHSLADNSVRHGGSVTVIKARAERAQDDLIITWEDDGVGVSSDDKEHIFQRGFGKNTGQGLFLSREILSMTGGTIAEVGVQGKGARFVIRIPKGNFNLNE